MSKKSKGFNELLRSQAISPGSLEFTKKSQTVKVMSSHEREFASSSNFEEQEHRIGLIVGLDEQGSVRAVNNETLAIYQNYLKTHLELPCNLTGTEDFSWEEYYIIGPGSKQEHDRLRQTKPSYLDTYELVEFKQEIDDWTGLQVSVKRVGDLKKFALPLADLEATDQPSINAQILDDYSVWFVNWR
jgi:hypothetical protein